MFGSIESKIQENTKELKETADLTLHDIEYKQLHQEILQDLYDAEESRDVVHEPTHGTYQKPAHSSMPTQQTFNPKQPEEPQIQVIHSVASLPEEQRQLGGISAFHQHPKDSSNTIIPGRDQSQVKIIQDGVPQIDPQPSNPELHRLIDSNTGTLSEVQPGLESKKDKITKNNSGTLLMPTDSFVKKQQPNIEQIFEQEKVLVEDDSPQKGEEKTPVAELVHVDSASPIPV